MGNDCQKAKHTQAAVPDGLDSIDIDDILAELPFHDDDGSDSESKASDSASASTQQLNGGEKPRRQAEVSERTAERYAEAIKPHQFAAVEDLAGGGSFAHPVDEEGGKKCEPAAMRRLMKEINGKLAKDLDADFAGSMFLRVDEERPQCLRALLSGVPGSPYASGLFMFDIFIPSAYPTTNPLVKHTTPGAQNVNAPGGYSPGGFSPNLHQHGGQVCLSLLGTWSSGEGWQASHNIYTVLCAIQHMILSAEHPYYMEPSYGGWEGTAPKSGHVPEVQQYDEEVMHGTARYAMADMLKSPPKGFEDAIREHFLQQRESILETLAMWSEDGSTAFQKRLAPVYSELKTLLEGLGDVPEPEGEEQGEELKPPALERGNSSNQP